MRTRNGVLLSTVFLLTLLTLLFAVLAWNGRAVEGICLSFSLSTIDQPGGYALSAGASPCEPLSTVD
jgi:hypothetical protein